MCEVSSGSLSMVAQMNQGLAQLRPSFLLFEMASVPSVVLLQIFGDNKGHTYSGVKTFLFVF